MSYPRKYPISTGAPLDERDWNALVNLHDGFTPAGVFRALPDYLITTDGTDTYACNAYQTIYGGPDDVGGIDGADANAVFQAVFTAIALEGAGSVYIKEGTYADLNLELVSNLQIVGAGIDRTILQGLDGENLFYKTDTDTAVSGIVIRDLTLEGTYNGATGTSGLINTQKVSGTPNTTVSYMTVQNVRFICETKRIGFHAGNIENLTVTHCRFDSPQNISDLMAFDGSNIKVAYCTFHRDLTDGGSLLTSGFGNYIKVCHNHFICAAAVPPYWSNGISLEDFGSYEDILVDGNSCVNCGIGIGGAEDLGGTFNNTRVINNTITKGSIAILAGAGGTHSNVIIKNNSVAEAVSATTLRMLGSIHHAIIEDNDFIELTDYVFSADDWVNVIFKNNVGYVTENKGFSTILNGNTTIVVAHGLDGYPTTLQVTPWGAECGNFWITNIGADEFTINCETASDGTFMFSWRAECHNWE
jgi:hypothetical protein